MDAIMYIFVDSKEKIANTNQVSFLSKPRFSFVFILETWASTPLRIIIVHC